MTNQVVFVSAARTAIGSFGRSLKDVQAARLATLVLEAAVAREGTEPACVGHVVFAMSSTVRHVTHTCRASQRLKAGLAMKCCGMPELVSTAPSTPGDH